MAYLRNRTINLINLQYGIFSLAMGAGGLFFFIYLLHAGFSVSLTLLTLAFILAGRLAIRPIVLVFAKRFGLKPTLVVGTVMVAFQYPLLVSVTRADWRLALLVAVAAIADTFYWSSYHAYFASLGDAEHRGHQIGAREALGALVGIVAPLLGAWMIVHAGGPIAFSCVGIIQALSAVPLLFTPNVAVRQSAPGVLKAAIPGILLFVFDGWFASAYMTLWQIALFLTLGQSFQAYGGAMALAALVGAASGMLLGRIIDQGKGRRALVIGYGSAAVVLAMRAASLHTPWLAVIANALGAFTTCVQVPVMMTVVYNLAKASPCPLRFHIATEGGWDTGGIAACVIMAALAACGVSLSWLLALGLPGLAVSSALLWRHYGASDLKVETPPVPEVPPGMTSL
jgi:MFS transporter, DHA1 family, inner membrane transport protein